MRAAFMNRHKCILVFGYFCHIPNMSRAQFSIVTEGYLN